MTDIKVIRKYESNNDLYDELIDLLLQLLKLHLSNSFVMEYNEGVTGVMFN